MGVEQALPHTPRLRRYARLLIGNRERADDLLQVTLERACRKQSLFQSRQTQQRSPQVGISSGLRGWLLSMMHNVFVNQVRAAPNETDLDEFVEEATHEPFAHTTERRDSQAALAQLSPDLREIILLLCENVPTPTAHKFSACPSAQSCRRCGVREKLRELLDETSPIPTVANTLKLVKTRLADHGL